MEALGVVPVERSDEYGGPDFDAFMTREWPGVLAFARATTTSWSEAEDLAQEAFLAAYRKWDEIARYDRPDAFVRRVVANQRVSGVRRRVRESAAVERLPRVEPVEDELGDPAFWRAVAALPPRQRQVVALFYVEDRPVADVAVVLGIAEGTVKTMLHAARKALTAVLSEEDDR